MITTLFGNNSFALRRRLNELIHDFVKEHGELALERIDAEEAEVQSILDALHNLPFLAVKTSKLLRRSNKLLARQAVTRI
jgi:fructose 1,6-bisphosphatase